MAESKSDDPGELEYLSWLPILHPFPFSCRRCGKLVLSGSLAAGVREKKCLVCWHDDPKCGFEWCTTPATCKAKGECPAGKYYDQ